MAGPAVGGASLGHGESPSEVGEGGFIDHGWICDDSGEVFFLIQFHESCLNDGDTGGGGDRGAVKDGAIVVTPVDIVQEVFDVSGTGLGVKNRVDGSEIGLEANCSGSVWVVKVRSKVVTNWCNWRAEEEEVWKGRELLRAGSSGLDPQGDEGRGDSSAVSRRNHRPVDSRSDGAARECPNTCIKHEALRQV